MRGRLIMVGGYVLAGIISCIALVGVAGSAEKAELPPAAPVEAQDSAAKEASPKSGAPNAQAKPKRSRRSSAKKSDAAQADAASKPRAKRGRKASKPTASQE